MTKSLFNNTATDNLQKASSFSPPTPLTRQYTVNMGFFDDYEMVAAFFNDQVAANPNFNLHQLTPQDLNRLSDQLSVSCPQGFPRHDSEYGELRKELLLKQIKETRTFEVLGRKRDGSMKVQQLIEWSFKTAAYHIDVFQATEEGDNEELPERANEIGHRSPGSVNDDESSSAARDSDAATGDCKGEVHDTVHGDDGPISDADHSDRIFTPCSDALDDELSAWRVDNFRGTVTVRHVIVDEESPAGNENGEGDTLSDRNTMINSAEDPPVPTTPNNCRSCPNRFTAGYIAGIASLILALMGVRNFLNYDSVWVLLEAPLTILLVFAAWIFLLYVGA